MSLHQQIDDGIVYCWRGKFFSFLRNVKIWERVLRTLSSLKNMSKYLIFPLTLGFHCFILLRYCFCVALLDIFSILTLLAFGMAATSVLDNLGSAKCSMLPLIRMGIVPGLGGATEPSAAAAWLAAADASSHSLVRPRKRWVMLPKVDAESRISALFRATWKISC